MNLRVICRPPLVLSTLLFAGAASFAIAVAVERNAADLHTETGAEAAHMDKPGSDTTSPAEQAGGDEATNADNPHVEEPVDEPADSSSEETLLGVNLESTALVVLATLVSLALSALTWRSNLRPLLLATAVFAAVFAVFDIAELVHQIQESRGGIAALAAVVGVLHVAATVVAGQRARSVQT